MNKERLASLGDVHETVDTTIPAKGIKRFLAYVGPAYMVSVGYMDPGNWATDLQGGAQFGYKLIWVLLMSNLMALVLQSFSARLGIVRRVDLAQANRQTYPPLINFCLYLLAELAIAATDLAEVLGMAIGLYLLFDLPILWGVGITVLDTFLFLLLQRYGIRKMEAFIIVLVATIGACFAIQLFLAKPNIAAVSKGFIPTSLSKAELYIAIGIIGATIMPHNLYLHSALVQTRKIKQDVEGIKRALRYNFIDSAIALNAAFFVNAGILVLAATAFYYTGNTQVAKIEDAHQLLAPLLGSTLAPILFAVALIAAGQSSTVTGTLAGQIVMEGYLHLRLNPWVRRLITRLIAIVPAVVVILIFGDEKLDDLLVGSQVILSIQLGFAIIPLLHFVSDKKTMGSFAITTPWKIIGWCIATILVSLNASFIGQEVVEIFTQSSSWFTKFVLTLAVLAFVALFFAMTFYPLFNKRRKESASLHNLPVVVNAIEPKPIQKIALALDFSSSDKAIIEQGLALGGTKAEYYLIHIVETVGAGYLGEAADDAESRTDEWHLQQYVTQLSVIGYHAVPLIGFNYRVDEIVRLVNQCQAQLLVMGSHKHSGFTDYLYGETVDKVRHKVPINVLIVNEN